MEFIKWVQVQTVAITILSYIELYYYYQKYTQIISFILNCNKITLKSLRFQTQFVCAAIHVATIVTLIAVLQHQIEQLLGWRYNRRATSRSIYYIGEQTNKEKK